MIVIFLLDPIDEVMDTEHPTPQTPTPKLGKAVHKADVENDY